MYLTGFNRDIYLHPCAAVYCAYEAAQHTIKRNNVLEWTIIFSNPVTLNFYSN